MATYTIEPRVREGGFQVDIVSDDGSRNTMLGFSTEQEAADWVESSKRIDAMRQVVSGD